MEMPKEYAIELQTKPLGFLVSIPAENGNTGGQYLFRLDKATAQALVVALLSQAEVAGTLDPVLLDDIATVAQKRVANDSAFLKEIGIA